MKDDFNGINSLKWIRLSSLTALSPLGISLPSKDGTGWEFRDTSPWQNTQHRLGPQQYWLVLIGRYFIYYPLENLYRNDPGQLQNKRGLISDLWHGATNKTDSFRNSYWPTLSVLKGDSHFWKERQEWQVLFWIKVWISLLNSNRTLSA